MEMNKYVGLSGIIVVTALSLSFLVNTIMFTYEATRRSADDLVKIESVKVQDDTKARVCKEQGGETRYSLDGAFIGCIYK